MGHKIFLGIIYEKFLKMGYEKFLRMGIEKFLRIGSDIFPGNNHKKISSPGQTPATVQCSSQEFLNGESSWNFSRKSPISVDIFNEFSCERFLEILTNSREFSRIFPEIVAWVEVGDSLFF